MTHAELQQVRGFFAGMEGVLEKSQGGSADYDALAEFRRWCWAALVLADDRACQEQIDLLVQYGNDLFSESDHRRWDTLGLPGVAVLRLKIGRTLASLRARLMAIERSHSQKRWRDLPAA